MIGREISIVYLAACVTIAVPASTLLVDAKNPASAAVPSYVEMVKQPCGWCTDSGPNGHWFPYYGTKEDGCTADMSPSPASSSKAKYSEESMGNSELNSDAMEAPARTNSKARAPNINMRTRGGGGGDDPCYDCQAFNACHTNVDNSTNDCGERHWSCWWDDTTNVQLASAKVEVAIANSNRKALEALLENYPSLIKFNEERRAIQLHGCLGSGFAAHFPIEAVLAAALSQIATETSTR